MKYPIYSVRDCHTGFMTPSVDINDNTAKRNFAHGINSSNSIMGFKPADFDLYHVGFFDTDSGLLEALSVPVLVVTGNAVFGATDAQNCK